MQTAVEYLIEQIKSDQNQKALSASEWMEVFEKARLMEKEQIIKAYTNGSPEFFDMAEEYYNETYSK